MSVRKVFFSDSTNGSGAYTSEGDETVYGFFEKAIFNASGLDSGETHTVSITSSRFGGTITENILVVAGSTGIDMIKYPRTLEHLDTSGADLSTHTRPFCAGHVTYTIAAGGATKPFSVIFYFNDV